jgi:hypothetical protein
MRFDPRQSGAHIALGGSNGNRNALPLPDVDLPMIF